MSNIKMAYAEYVESLRMMKAIERDLAPLKKIVEEKKAALMAEMSIIGTDVFAGPLGRVTLVKGSTYVVRAERWLELYEFIRENEAFDLLHKRLSTTAYKERIDEGQDVPGVDKMETVTLRYTQG